MTHNTSLSSPARMILVVGFYLYLVALGVSSAETAGEPPSSTSTPTATASNTPNPSDTPTSTITPSHTPTPDAKPPPSSPTPTDTATATPSPTNTATATATPTQTLQASSTPSPTSTASETPSQTPSATATPSPTAPKSPSSYPPQAILIHEVAWAGTLASAYDEWIELHNPGATPIDLTGWHLVLGEDKNIGLLGTLPAYGFYLMERTDDSTVADISADLIYTGGLKNSGDRLRLFDPSGGLVDSADYAGGWPAGEAASRFTMERLGGVDIPGNWVTFVGSGGNGIDAEGNPIPGTPRQPNSIFAPTATPTSTPTPTIAPALTPYPPQSVLINEIAWAGTLASANDEWIELHNPGSEDINLTGWTLTDGADINIALSGLLPPYSFYLLERSDDTSVADIFADRIYTGCLSNGGETLYLIDPTGDLVDSANLSSSKWPAGEVSSRASMERRGGEDISGNWGTFTGYHGVGHDADGNPIPGTPRTTNSLFFPTPVPTWIPSKVVINEVLIRPHYDWEGDGSMSTSDEFIEIYNRGPSTVNIQGWYLDDIPDGGSRPFELPSMKLHTGDFAVFFRSQTRIALNDSGDTVRLFTRNGRVLDQIQYLKVRAYNLSYGCLPDGRKYLYYGLWPTPGGPNVLFEEPSEEAFMPLTNIHMRLARLGRFPSLVCWVNALGYISPPERPAEP